MRKRLIVLLAAIALLLVGAVPVSAAPGGVPGPPPGHGKPADEDIANPDTDVDTSSVPDWAKAYGLRIQEEYGMTYGHLQQCAGLSDDTNTDVDEVSTVDLECPEDLEFPEDDHGAKAFWVFTQQGMLIVGL